MPGVNKHRSSHSLSVILSQRREHGDDRSFAEVQAQVRLRCAANSRVPVRQGTARQTGAKRLLENIGLSSSRVHSTFCNTELCTTFAHRCLVETILEKSRLGLHS